MISFDVMITPPIVRKLFLFQQNRCFREYWYGSSDMSVRKTYSSEPWQNLEMNGDWCMAFWDGYLARHGNSDKEEAL
jgi:hypothetical protein